MKKEPLTYKLWAKILAYFLLAVFACGLLGSAIGIVGAWEFGIYTGTLEERKQEQFKTIAISAGENLVRWVLWGDYEAAERQTALKNAEYRVTDHTGTELWRSAGFDADAGGYRYAFAYRWNRQTRPDGGTYDYVEYLRSYDLEPGALEETDYVMEAELTAFGRYDEFYWISKALDLLWSLRYAVYVIGALCLAGGVACFVFLMCGAGHRSGHAELVPGYLYKLPFDLLTAMAGFLGILGAYAGAELTYDPFSEALSLLLIGLLLIAAVLLGTGWCASFAMRVKLGKWWRNTVVYFVLHLLWRVHKGFWHGVGALLRNLPLVWKTILGLVGISFVEFIFVALNGRDELVLLWFLEKAFLVFPLVLYLALTLRKLQKGGAALAAGDLGYQTDTKFMVWDFKAHGENLNSIADGMTRAVEERTRSERLKTELITNVSHDIKTPLTSIINYVDLLKRNDDPAQEAEYLDVLDRQSRKLKKLTEDLVELSKASTGNLAVNASRHSVSELLRQAAGEYSERLWDAGIEAVLTLPEPEVYARVDGNLTWRVLDNLFSNVCKYGQSGTRFYIDALAQEGFARVSFKNISRERLNVPADELLERFVRGDSARGGEGSGLGLNIARSLVELQGGTFVLSVDGDLFKVELALPLVWEQGQSGPFPGQ